MQDEKEISEQGILMNSLLIIKFNIAMLLILNKQLIPS